MKTLADYMIQDSDVIHIDDVVKWINLFITSSSAIPVPSKHVLQFLAKYARPEKPITVYRGISLIYTNLDKERRIEAMKFKSGDTTPKWLGRKTSEYSSYTKKLSIAKQYSQGGRSVVLSCDLIPEMVIADLEMLSNLTAFIAFKSYFLTSKEVIVKEPIETKIFSAQGKFL